MAYFIFHSDNLISIAANETDKNSLPIPDVYTVKNVSDSDFLKVKKQIAGVSISGDNVVVTDYESNGFNDEDGLQIYHKGILSRINEFLNAGNEDKSLHGAITTYKTVLEGFDTSTITYPMTQTWEEYCEDNSIAYVSPLQIP
mgnify:CR=1 FL=1|tara:strand:+ start:44 stop:472 length:429 start_codon:yes stop_codon:yes gene_type:complete